MHTHRNRCDTCLQLLEILDCTGCEQLTWTGCKERIDDNESTIYFDYTNRMLQKKPITESSFANNQVFHCFVQVQTKFGLEMNAGL